MKHTLYDNFDLWETYTDEELTELARDNGIIEEDEKPTDALLWELRTDEDALAWDAIKEELTRFFDGKTVIFYGIAGTWRGSFDGGKIGDFWTLYGEAFKDCDYISITDENGALIIKGAHHDGTNIYRVKELTPAGVDYFDRWQYGTDARTERHAHAQIVKRYSHRPKFWERVFC